MTHLSKSNGGYLRYALVSLSVLALLAALFLFKKSAQQEIYTRLLMGTMVEFTLMQGDRAMFQQAADAAFEEIERLEAIFSSYIPTSEISRISTSSGPVKVSPEVIHVVGVAVKISELSKGAFDPTVGALAELWGLSGEKEIVPEKQEVNKLLGLVDYKAIYIDKKNSLVGLKKKGMSLNLGGVAKGFIVNSAVEVLKNHGVKRGIVKAGGDLVVFEKVRTNSDPFVIGIQHPRTSDKLLGEVRILNGAVTTSGDYERFFIKDGKRYHHILDPVTGFPAERSRSVTIVSLDPTFADALSTAVFVMGPQDGMSLVEGLDGVEAVIVDSNGELHVSSGLEGGLEGGHEGRFVAY